MTFKKNWKTIGVVVSTIGLFVTTAAVQADIPPQPHNLDVTTLVIEDSVDPTKADILNEDSKLPTAPITSAPTVEESSDSVVEELQTSGYTISYVSREFDKYLLQVMKEFNINLDASYVYATIFCESTFRNAVESPLGAVGYMQVLPSTRDYILPMIKSEFPQYSELSVDLTNPYTNIVYGLYYFRHIAESFGNTDVNENNINKILTCYNRGITGGERYFNSTGHWNSEYAQNIIRVAEQIRANGGM